MDRPNWLLDIPAEEYHAATKRNEYTTSHRLNLFRKCPALYRKHITGEIVEGDTEAFVLGRAVHTLVLEGELKFVEEYIVSDGPVNPKTGKPYGKATKAYQEWAAEQPKPVISPEDFALMAKMREAVHAHPVAADLLSAGFAEGTIRTEWSGEHVQCRMDWFDPDRSILVDFKTCEDVDKLKFAIRDFGYVTQLAFYKKCLEIVGYEKAKKLKGYLVAVEKKEPFRVAVVEISPYTLDEGNTAFPGAIYGTGNETLIEELKDCRAKDVWPTRYEEPIRI